MYYLFFFFSTFACIFIYYYFCKLLHWHSITRTGMLIVSRWKYTKFGINFKDMASFNYTVKMNKISCRQIEQHVMKYKRFNGL